MNIVISIIAKRVAETIGIVELKRHTVARRQVNVKNVYTTRIVMMAMIVKITNAFGLDSIVLVIRNVQRIGSVMSDTSASLDATIAMKTAQKRRHTVARGQVNVKSAGLMNIATVGIIRNVTNIDV